MKNITKCLLLIFFLIFFAFKSSSVYLFAQSQQPSFEPLFSPSQILNQNIEQTPYTSYTANQVFEIALLFSECQKESQIWDDCWKKFADIKEALSTEEIMSLSEEERGREILKYLYQNYLKKYSLNQTKLDIALETGFYNCVSSALLYMAAAKAAGLDVRGQRTSHHAFCSIYIPYETGDKSGQLKKIDVETTNPYGFNPGSKEEIEHSNQIKEYYIVPKKFYSNRTEVSDGIFTGLIAGNLTSEYIKTGNYIKALPLGAARWETIKSEPADSTSYVRNEFDILAANYVNLIPDSAQAYSEKLDWFSDFIDHWGTTNFLQKNLDSSFLNLLVLCNKENNTLTASDAWEKYRNKISTSQTTKAEEILTDIIILSATDNLPPEEKISVVNQLLKEDVLSSPVCQKRSRIHLENFWLFVLNPLMNSHDFEKGYEKAAIALTQLPDSPKMKTMHKNFYNNMIASIHNSFAKQLNAGNYEQALSILQSGLEKFPDDKILKKDLINLLQL